MNIEVAHVSGDKRTTTRTSSPEEFLRLVEEGGHFEHQITATKTIKIPMTLVEEYLAENNVWASELLRMPGVIAKDLREKSFSNFACAINGAFSTALEAMSPKEAYDQAVRILKDLAKEDRL